MMNNQQILLCQLGACKIAQTSSIDWYSQNKQIALKPNSMNLQQPKRLHILTSLTQCRTHLNLSTKLSQLMNLFTISYSIIILTIVSIIVVNLSQLTSQQDKNMWIIIIMTIGIPLDLIVLYFALRKLNTHVDIIQNALKQLSQHDQYQYKTANIVKWKSYINIRNIEVYQKYN